MSKTIIQPTYLSVQPSTGKKISFRPFTVKEEKSLLLALQENSLETVAQAIKNVVSVCTNGQVDPEVTPYYDIEFLYLQIRAKSVGEIIDLVGSCECGVDNKTDFSIDIADAKIEPVPTGTSKIKIPDTNYTIEFRHPSIDNMVDSFIDAEESSERVIASCIITVFTDDEVMDWNFQEKFEFVESMTTKQQKDVAIFMHNMPMVKMIASYTCKHCGKPHTNILSGFENFFV